MSVDARSTLVKIDRLSVVFPEGESATPVLHELTLSLGEGERLCLLGESGSGKTITARSIAGLLPAEARVSGTITWPALMSAPIPGRDFGVVFQDPMSSLNPVLRIEEQIGEVLITHGGATWLEAREGSIALLEQVGIADASKRVRGYPHEFSGGQRQRIAIAIAIAARPRLLIADEPTTALDTIVQAQIMTLIDSLTASHRMGLALITHDVALAAGLADRLAILYAGRLMELGPVATVTRAPRHPYTRALIEGSLDFDRPLQDRLLEIPGSLPAPDQMPRGCPFAPRCSQAIAACRDAMPPWTGSIDNGVACWLQ